MSNPQKVFRHVHFVSTKGDYTSLSRGDKARKGIADALLVLVPGLVAYYSPPSGHFQVLTMLKARAGTINGLPLYNAGEVARRAKSLAEFVTSKDKDEDGGAVVESDGETIAKSKPKRKRAAVPAKVETSSPPEPLAKKPKKNEIVLGGGPVGAKKGTSGSFRAPANSVAGRQAREEAASKRQEAESDSGSVSLSPSSSEGDRRVLTSPGANQASLLRK